MSVSIDLTFVWEKFSEESRDVYAARNVAFAKKISAESLDHVSEKLQAWGGMGAGVVETQEYILAWVDHVRSIPIFYSEKNDGFQISNNPRKIISSGDEVDSDSAIEFAMAGYVAAEKTLFSSVKKLRPGQFLIWDKIKKTLNINFYFRYVPDHKITSGLEDNKKKLGEILDDMTRDIIARHQGKTFYIPLSGGLDSRILLCKLHEHGARNIQTFTYGPRFNFESFKARRIAKKLNVPWEMISISKEDAYQSFQSEERKRFWEYADHMSGIPCMREYDAIRILKERGVKDAVFINGQSGDYISGDHINDYWFEEHNPSFNDLLRIIMNKHYDLWASLKNTENKNVVESSVKVVLKPFEVLSFAEIEDFWEYEGRQVSYVINGQRVYEFCGYDWELPLWDKSLVDFFSQISLAQKQGQSLYKEYLRDYNYMGLFPEKESYIPRWPAPMIWVLAVAQIVGLLGKATKKEFYARMRYFGHYANQYAFFEWKEHKKTSSVARNVISLFVRQWVKENPEIFDDEIKEAMKI